jgi:hypothetical protein
MIMVLKKKNKVDQANVAAVDKFFVEGKTGSLRKK